MNRKYTIAFKLHTLELAHGLAGEQLKTLLADLDVPRSTYQYWVRRQAQGALDSRKMGRPPVDSVMRKSLRKALKPVLDALDRIEKRMES